MAEQSQNLPATPEGQSDDEQIYRADPVFKEVTDKLARSVGLRVVGAELPQTLTADLVLEIPPEATNLEDTLFDFLQGYDYAIVDFKGQADPLDIHKFLVNLARTALFCVKNKAQPVDRVLNLLVCSRYPQEIISSARPYANLVQSDKTRPWLWQGQLFFQKIIIIVCRDLPVEPRYYEWLVFIPSDNRKWPHTVQILLEARRFDLLSVIRKLHPKEYKGMELSIDYNKIYQGMAPKERKKLLIAIGENMIDDLPKLSAESPEVYKKVLESVPPKEFLKALTPEQLEEVRRLLAETDKLEDASETENK